MIFAKGRLWPSSRQDEILSGLEAYINRVRATKTLSRETVIRALSALGDRIWRGEFDGRIASLAAGEDAARYKKLAVSALNRENIELRLARELGSGPMPSAPGIRTEFRPLGTLFHIAAGNMDGLPALSAAEGLLTGNFNILKLPQADSGLTVEILSELCRAEPEIADFVAVFDTPSSDVAAMKKMAEMADGIVLWGGEEAERAVRNLAPAGAKLIEWGHRLGFCYVKTDFDALCAGDPDPRLISDLSGLAEHIALTGQLLCSSCQTVFLDTARREDMEAFARIFLPLLEEAVKKHPPAEIGVLAARSIRQRMIRMERALEKNGIDTPAEDRGSPEKDRAILEGRECSLILCRDSSLELSPLCMSVPVKRLPEKNLLPTLRRGESKGRLQTAGLICPDEDRGRLTDLLLRAGLTRVTAPARMSEPFPGESHDGEYPLRRYVRAADVEELGVRSEELGAARG